MKTCTKCGEEKPLDQFPPNRKKRDGLNHYCRPCWKAYMADYYARNADRLKAEANRHYHANSERALENSLRWQRANRQRSNATKARWLAKNRDKHSETNKRYRQANPEAQRLKSLRWHRANPEKVALKARKYQKSHPEMKRSIDATRHKRYRSAPGRGVRPSEWRAIRADSMGLCVYCNDRRRLSMDHIDPISRGGAHDPDNIVAACKSCNSSKNDTPLLQWLARRRVAA